MKFLAFVVLWGVLVTGAPGQPRLPAATSAVALRSISCGHAGRDSAQWRFPPGAGANRRAESE